MSATQQFERFKAHFCEALKILCQESGSINKICRDLGINRQQFTKYMSGTNMPSPFLIQKLADDFEISPSVFFLNVETSNIRQHFVSNSGLSNEIVGYYLEYTLVEAAGGAQVAVAAWRLYRRGAVVIAHGEVPYVEPSTGQRWFSRYTGTVTDSHRQIMMSAYNSGEADSPTGNMLWVFRPYRHGASDLMAIKVQADQGNSRPICSTTSYFRAIGAEPNLSKIVLDECGIFERDRLNPRAAAIIELIDSTRSMSPTQLKLLAT